MEIAEGLAHSRLRGDAGATGGKPGLERIPERARVLLPIAMAVCGREVACGLLHGIEPLGLFQTRFGEARFTVLALRFNDLIKLPPGMRETPSMDQPLGRTAAQ
ncbi:MAG TPA: hypothetical protein VMV40_05210 [Acidiferrobacter sp.]|nr:hypothetical protein [Acidiferrobacter sp.]